jgi:hypothetical protein
MPSCNLFHGSELIKWAIVEVVEVENEVAVVAEGITSLVTRFEL